MGVIMDYDLNLNILSDMDKNLNVLADIKADIIYRKHFNKPVSDSTLMKFTLCYSQLPLCDQMRVDSQANMIAAMDIHRVEQYRKSKSMEKYLFIGTAAVCTAIILIGIALL